MQPYFQLRSQQTQYVGPADQQATAEQLSDIRIGYFGPSDPHHASAGQMWRGAQLALDEANREGGYQGKPFRLLPVWSQDPWGTGVKQLTRLVYEDHVWAIVGGVDGATTHLAEQVVAKARLPLVSPVSTDKTVNLANVPWMFSLAPADDLIAAALAPSIAQRAGSDGLVIVSANDHDSCLLTRELRKELTKLKLAPTYQFEFRPDTDRFEDLVRACLASKPKVVVAVADAEISLQVVRCLREQGFSGPIFGGPGFAQASFRSHVTDTAGQLLCPVLTGAAKDPRRDGGESTRRLSLLSTLPLPSQPLPSDFDYTALQTYDAVRMTVEAIRQGGLSRTDIGQALRDLSPCYGISGRIQWDGLGSNIRLPSVATISPPEK